MTLKYTTVRDVKAPSRAHKWDAGIDFYIPYDMEWESFVLYPGISILIPSGIKMDIPRGFMLLSLEKSSIAKTGLICGARVIDSGHQGEIHIHLMNVSKKEVIIRRGDKIVQFIPIPVPYYELEKVELDFLYEEQSARGTGGFGSTKTI